MKPPSSTPPPIITVNDRVLLHYAILDDSVGYKSGHRSVFVDGQEIGRVPCLAICQDKDSPKIMLYYCESDWSLIGITSYDTVAAAKQGAERIYPRSSGCWVEAHFSEDDAKRYLEEKLSDLRCSFCGKLPVEPLSQTFEGDGNARICGGCVREFYGDLSQHSR
jgi:hypothetical protein